jgi:putative hydrolase of the HAD superfamily
MEPHLLPWGEIDSVLLDMDGTLLDRYFDDYFWEEYVPKQFAHTHNQPLAEASRELHALYKSHEGTLNWTDIDFWSARLGLDIPALKEGVADRVTIHPGVIPFLSALRTAKKQVVLMTNAHPKTVAIKFKRVPIAGYFDAIVCSSEIGAPKEEAAFWTEAQRRIGFDKQRSLFIDDTEAVLTAAQTFGIRFLLYKANASSRAPTDGSGRFIPLRRYEEMKPVGVKG